MHRGSRKPRILATTPRGTKNAAGGVFDSKLLKKKKKKKNGWEWGGRIIQPVLIQNHQVFSRSRDVEGIRLEERKAESSGEGPCSICRAGGISGSTKKRKEKEKRTYNRERASKRSVGPGIAHKAKDQRKNSARRGSGVRAPARGYRKLSAMGWEDAETAARTIADITRSDAVLVATISCL